MIAVVLTRERSCDAAGPGLHVPPGRLVEVRIGDDVGHGQPASRPEHPGRLREGHGLVGREIDDAVGNDNVHTAYGQGDVLDLALQELDIGQAGLPNVAPGEGKHLVGHIDSVDLAGRTHPSGREDDIDPAAGAEIEHDLALLKGGDRQGIAASERGQDRSLGQMAQLPIGVLARPEAGVSADATGTGRPTAAVLLRTFGGDDRELRIPGPDRLLRCLGLKHRRLPFFSTPLFCVTRRAP